MDVIIPDLWTLTEGADVSSWSASFNSGQWKDVDYTTGCAARRANWPATVHWLRTATLAAAWHGGLQGAEILVNNDNVKTTVFAAMDWWFARDFKNNACLLQGGTKSCPCSNKDHSMWDPNWFSNVIGVPMRVAETCLLLGKENLDEARLSNCTHMTRRAYGTFQSGFDALTGANTLDVARIGIDLALLTDDPSLLADAYNRVHGQLKIQDGVKVDGIQSDGSFGQHRGLMYNGNYGKDFANDILYLEIPAGGTEFSADATAREAFTKLMDADRWMIYRNTDTGVLHWDFSALGRFITLPVADAQATANININVSQVGLLGEQWSSSDLTDFATQLSSTSSSANAGDLKGNRMFYANDYMVHRGEGYVSSVKMYSKRTLNTECVNSQNPLGFHLSDGALYTYLKGNEYEDIAAAMDWQLIPGITIDYGATPLNCTGASFTGVQNLVGGVSDGQIGIAAMRYTNPSTHSLRFQKAWFFLQDDIQHVMISNLTSQIDAPVLSVLDQKRHSGTVLVDGLEKRDLGGDEHPGAKSLWHDNVGYVFDPSDQVTLTVQVGQKQGSWSKIGTSTQPDVNADLFTAYLKHDNIDQPISYSIFPATSSDTFATKQQNIQLQTLQNDAHISAIHDAAHSTSMIVFWDASGGSIQISPAGQTSVTITSTAAAAVIYNFLTGNVTVSDPSQTLKTMTITLTSADGGTKTLNYDLTGAPGGATFMQTSTTFTQTGAAWRRSHFSLPVLLVALLPVMFHAV